MNLKQFNECGEVVNWCGKNVYLLLRAGLSPDEIVNVCRANLLPAGPEYISDIAATRIVESNFI